MLAGKINTNVQRRSEPIKDRSFALAVVVVVVDYFWTREEEEEAPQRFIGSFERAKKSSDRLGAGRNRP